MADELRPRIVVRMPYCPMCREAGRDDRNVKGIRGPKDGVRHHLCRTCNKTFTSQEEPGDLAAEPVDLAENGDPAADDGPGYRHRRPSRGSPWLGD